VEHIISDATENVATIVDEKTEVHVLQPDEALPRQALSAPPKAASQVRFVATAFMADAMVLGMAMQGFCHYFY